jgi:tubby and related proteins
MFLNSSDLVDDDGDLSAFGSSSTQPHAADAGKPQLALPQLDDNPTPSQSAAAGSAGATGAAGAAGQTPPKRVDSASLRAEKMARMRAMAKQKQARKRQNLGALRIERSAAPIGNVGTPPAASSAGNSPMVRGMQTSSNPGTPGSPGSPLFGYSNSSSSNPSSPGPGRMQSTNVTDHAGTIRNESKFHMVSASSLHSNDQNNGNSRSNGKLNESDSMTSLEREMMAQGLAPTFDPRKPNSKKSALDLSDMRTFLTTAIPREAGTLQCVIYRNKSGLSNKLFPSYVLEHDGKFLLCAKKRSANKTSNYIVSMEKKVYDKKSMGYVGKLRSNFVGTEFTLFDKGCNPSEVEQHSSVAQVHVRQELVAVFYEANLLRNRGPRKMTVLLPKLDSKQNREVWQPMKPEDAIISKYKESPQHCNLQRLINKPPQWHDELGAYVLNFNGRVTMASVKNFQLVHDEDEETVLLQFGRVDKDRFTMDVCWPLSPLQAFGICLSSFDNKLSCE